METLLGFLSRIWAAVQGLRARRAAADVKAGEEIIRQADAEAAVMQPQPPPLPSSKPN